MPGTGGKQLNMNYEVRTPFVYNLDFVGKFDYSVDLCRTCLKASAIDSRTRAC